MTPRLLPESDQELLIMWDLQGRNNVATAAVYGVNESQVRRRVRRALGPSQRQYNKIPITVEELYAEWLELGARYGHGKVLADKYGCRPGTIRRALRLYRQRNSEEEERREQELDQAASRQPACVPGRARGHGAGDRGHRLPQRAAGRSVR